LRCELWHNAEVSRYSGGARNVKVVPLIEADDPFDDFVGSIVGALFFGDAIQGVAEISVTDEGLAVLIQEEEDIFIQFPQQKRRLRWGGVQLINDFVRI
jgi:hypothetical protein